MKSRKGIPTRGNPVAKRVRTPEFRQRVERDRKREDKRLNDVRPEEWDEVAEQMGWK